MNELLYPPMITINPLVLDYGVLDYHRTKEAISIGYLATKELLPVIKKMLSRTIIISKSDFMKKVDHPPVRTYVFKKEMSG
jgi:predicted acylesterase/phospholipase RssA